MLRLKEERLLKEEELKERPASAGSPSPTRS